VNALNLLVLADGSASTVVTPPGVGLGGAGAGLGLGPGGRGPGGRGAGGRGAGGLKGLLEL
tara:strand:- start:173 stop:355 length:183 start_codon:yes stop_codon:yes gene_type:complete